MVRIVDKHYKGFSYYTKIQRQNKDEESTEVAEALSDLKENPSNLQGNSI